MLILQSWNIKNVNYISWNDNDIALIFLIFPFLPIPLPFYPCVFIQALLFRLGNHGQLHLYLQRPRSKTILWARFHPGYEKIRQKETLPFWIVPNISFNPKSFSYLPTDVRKDGKIAFWWGFFHIIYLNINLIDVFFMSIIWNKLASGSKFSPITDIMLKKSPSGISFPEGDFYLYQPSLKANAES